MREPITDQTPIKECASKQYDFRFKYTVFGSKNSGKSALILRFIKNEYSDYPILTLETDMNSVTIELGYTNILINLWDSECRQNTMYENISDTEYKEDILDYNTYRGNDGIVLCVDLTTDLKTANQDISHWLNDIKFHVHPKNPIAIMIVGTKADSASRQLSNSDISKILLKFQVAFPGIFYMETSAKNDYDISITKVENAFFELTEKILRKRNPELFAKPATELVSSDKKPTVSLKMKSIVIASSLLVCGLISLTLGIIGLVGAISLHKAAIGIMIGAGVIAVGVAANTLTRPSAR